METRDHCGRFIQTTRVQAPARIAIVDDESLARDAFRQILGASSGCRCLGTFADAGEALDCIPQIRLDLVLMDIRMPGGSGIECARQLKLWNPNLKILMVTGLSEVHACLESIKAGACGYVTKPFAKSFLLRAIAFAMAGGMPLAQDISRKLLESYGPECIRPVSPSRLTQREREIMRWLSQGLADKQIAEITSLSVYTVQSYLKQIRRKLGVQSRTAAVVKWADLDEGLPCPGQELTQISPEPGGRL
jgi:two-component system, NarL family, response regulator LiaR